MAKEKKLAADASAAANIQAAVATAVEATPVAPEPPYLFGEVVASEIALSLEQGKIESLDPAWLSIERGFNVRDFTARENQEHVANLRALIEANGLETPLWVRVIDSPDEGGARIVVRRGESRLRAIRAIREDKGASAFTTVQVLVMPDKSDADQTADFAVESSGKPLSLLEQLTVVNRLKTENWKPAEIGRRLNYSHTHLRNLTVLDWATPTIRDFVKGGWLSASWTVEQLRPTEGDAEKVAALEKKLAKLVAKKQEEGKQAAKGVKVEADDEKGDARKKPGDGIQFSRATFNGLIEAMQATLEVLTPASQYKVPRQILRNALENVGAPLVRPATKAAAEAAKAAEEEAS